MRVLLDESIPRQLAHFLTGHSVTTVQREGWAGATNGELLRRASERFDVLVTGDRNLEFQQEIAPQTLGIVVLIAPNNRVETIVALAPRILEEIERLQRGQLVRIEAR